ncbi:hypothetical protein Tco_0544223 [Tanacetum coccineum]
MLRSMGCTEILLLPQALKEEESFRESEFYLATTPQLMRTQSAILRNTLEAEEMYKRIEFAIVARDDAVEAKKIEKKTWMVLECMGNKGLAECKASASNLRGIQVKDIVKEVEDYLKTYSSAEMDISSTSEYNVSVYLKVVYIGCVSPVYIIPVGYEQSIE